ncbi:MAG TPA: SET domain-containing protein-lysine N-methyltransferase [Pseudonocardiaceae bacterium]|nr:SET domain-containing protein-lysine N-methyltransferase [Pseudonocardiaceae bacterium]
MRIANDAQKGFAVVATRQFSSADVVVIGRPTRVVPCRTTHSFQVGWETHVDLDEPARLVNHSCDPNMGIQDNGYGGFDFIALRDVAPNEEITWDYETSEYLSVAVPRCLCGTANCRKVIRGFRERRNDPHWHPVYVANYLNCLREDAAAHAPAAIPRITSTSVASGPVTERCHGDADRQ